MNYDIVRTVTPELYDGRRIDFTLHIGMASSRNHYSIESQAHKGGYTTGDVDGKRCSYAIDGRKLAVVPQTLKKMDNKTNEAKTSEISPGVTKPSVLAGYTNEYGDQTPPQSHLKAAREAEEAQESGVGKRIVEDWTSLPDVLHPDVDVQRVLRSWDHELKVKADLRVSNDAGRYLCEYIYWCSLAHREVSRQGAGKVLFLHVPGSAEEKDVAQGVDVVVALCKAIVHEMMDKGEVGRDAGDRSVVQVSDEVRSVKTGDEKTADANDKSHEDEQTEDKKGPVKENQEVKKIFYSLDEVAKDIAEGKLKINEEGMGIDTEEDSDEDSDDGERVMTPSTASGEMEGENGDNKSGARTGYRQERRKRAPKRKHTNRTKTRKPVPRWPDLQQKTKERNAGERAEAEVAAAVEGQEEESKEKKKDKGKGKAKENQEEEVAETLTPRRIVVDKEYLGYVMAIPKDEPFSG